MKHIILAYHHFTVDEFHTKSKLYIDKDKFRSHLEALLKSDYTASSTIEEVVEQKKAFHITVDDGYSSFYNIAYPLLKEYNLAATLFVPTSRIGLSCFEQDYGHIQNYCSKEQLLEMSASGLVTIASHGHNHVKLREYTYHQQYNDINTSLERLENLHFNSKVFCYPYGSFNEDTQRILKSLKFVYACSTITGSNSYIDQYALQRVAPHSTMYGSDLLRLLDLL